MNPTDRASRVLAVTVHDASNDTGTPGNISLVAAQPRGRAAIMVMNTPKEEVCDLIAATVQASAEQLGTDWRTVMAVIAGSLEAVENIQLGMDDGLQGILAGDDGLGGRQEQTPQG